MKTVSGRRSFLFIAAINLGLLLVVFLLMGFIQRQMHQDVRLNLTEIATQNKNLITGNLTMALSQLELGASQLADRFAIQNATDQESRMTLFRALVEEQNDPSMIYSDLEGNALSGTGKQFSIATHDYFKLGIIGTSTISDRIISPADGASVFVLCVPIIDQNTIIGTIQKQYTPQEIYDLCAVSLYSEEGASYIINAKGDILISSTMEADSSERKNYYELITTDNPKAAKQLAEDVRLGHPGFMETSINGKQLLSVYTPIEEIHDWYLISSISFGTILPHGNRVIQVFYLVLLVIVAMFLLSIFYYRRLTRIQRENLERVAFVDTVTGGDSHTKFNLRLASALGKLPDAKLYLCSLDIDNFKFINSFYGFEMGDHILKTIYQDYQKKLGSDECIARITADRFAFLLTDITPQRLNTLFDFNAQFSGVKVYLSVGIYAITDPQESLHLMLDKAHTASRVSKGKYFKRVEFYTEGVDQQNVHDEQLKRAVEQALAADEIIPYFQPKVDVQTRQLMGAEALARWCKPDGTVIPPGDFIPMCEYTGLICLVDMVIFEKTLQFLRRHLDAGTPCVPISVNFSRLHLLDNAFLDSLLVLLKQYQIPPSLIELELTETVIYDNHQSINAFIGALHSHGLKISIDDFGSGYSSLHLLKDINIDVLKIDRAFLQDSASNPRIRTIFGSIVQMAQQLDVAVVVEGVETLENVALMNEFDCCYAQGFFYAKPMDTTRFDAVLTVGSV